jgi:YhcH/YjgK/YiaL family protein
MIFGNIKDLESSFAWLPKPLKMAVEHLKTTDFAALSAGNYELQGKDIHVQVIDMNTRPFADTHAEVHRRYIDVQFLVHGCEKIGVASDTGNNLVDRDKLVEHDLLLYTSMENESTLTMTPGCFAIFLPTDVHRPGCAVDQPLAIRKVVVKVSVSLLS